MRLSPIALALTIGVSAPAVAGNLVTNGGFEINGGGGQIGWNTTVAGWSVPTPNNSYAFLFPADSGAASGTTADNGGVNGEYGSLQLWGPGNGPSNGLMASPNGGAFVALDSDFQSGALAQTITGLKPGGSYKLAFDWAVSQQAGFTGPTTQDLQVSLGSQTFDTPTIDLPSEGFQGWQQSTFTFTASASSEVLSFLAAGSPQVPPFMLVDGVSLSPVPEPASLGLLGVGVLGLGVQRMRRRR